MVDWPGRQRPDGKRGPSVGINPDSATKHGEGLKKCLSGAEGLVVLWNQSPLAQAVVVLGCGALPQPNRPMRRCEFPAQYSLRQFDIAHSQTSLQTIYAV